MTNESDYDAYKAALKRVRLILDTSPYWLDDKGYTISTNDELDDAQTFLRNNLSGDMTWANDDYEHLTRERAQLIYADILTLWGYPYARDAISHIAIELSLCPLHFCDWASCFDDDDDDCTAIRAIFPHDHDT